MSNNAEASKPPKKVPKRSASQKKPPAATPSKPPVSEQTASPPKTESAAVAKPPAPPRSEPAAAPKPTADQPAAALPKAEPAAKAKPPADQQAAAPPKPEKAAAASPQPVPEAVPQRALVVDDEPANLNFLMRLLEQAQLEVTGASTAAEALRIAEGGEPMALIVVDNRLPDMDGIELMARLRACYPAARMVMATMLDEPELIRTAFQNGCDVYVVKPHGFMELFRRWQMLQTGEDKLQRLIIDHFGPRPFRG
jgi:CheY-like chemotaxis protein